jgi:2,4-dienoyl-CoA reductase-like NADH-dependent reductase (Old Yellow Enzyme family)
MGFSVLFSPENIGAISIPNRIIRSATYTALTTNGYMTDRALKYYRTLAQGGVGLIISGHIAVDRGGIASVNQARIYDDSFLSGQQALVSMIHNIPDVKVAAQIAHSGRKYNDKMGVPVGPSGGIPNLDTHKTPREMTRDDIQHIITQFAHAGRRCYESGYDMVQLHSAHGYLLSSFITPFTNQRTDEYGGSIMNRTRILTEIYQRIRETTDKKFPIMIKLNTQDTAPGGLREEETLTRVHILADTGFAGIEISGGLGEGREIGKNSLPCQRVHSAEEENYLLSTAKNLQPIMAGHETKQILMGGIRNPIIADQILQNGHADFVSMSRPLIHEPNLPNRWKNGETSPAKCISCNGCFLTFEKGLHCYYKAKKAQRQKRTEEKREKKK